MPDQPIGTVAVYHSKYECSQNSATSQRIFDSPEGDISLRPFNDRDLFQALKGKVEWLLDEVVPTITSTDLKNCGLSDIIVACIDGLSGFAAAIHAAYPQAKVQSCVAHLVRAALEYVQDKDSREVIPDLQAISRSATAEEAERQLDRFAAK